MGTVFTGAGKTSADKPEVTAPASGRKTLLILAMICLVAICAYANVLFNFFVGDDFVHLTWLKDAAHNPELVLRNFHASWLDGTTTRFYRPLISVFMLLDYLISGTNAISFHITNVLFLLIGAIFLFHIARHLQKLSANSDDLTFPVAACALFALYPLHPEAVSWITGRVDAIVTAFYLASVWFYMRWRTKQAHVFWTILFFVCALMSKEMAVTVPVVFVLYEICFKPDKKPDTTPDSRKGPAVIHALAKTAPFWLLLAIYFGVRFISLGTLVGGYDDSLTFISNWSNFIGSWLHGLRMLFVPINRSLIGPHNAFTIAWEVSISLMLAFSIFNLVRNKQLLPCFTFFLCVSIVSLVPVYKLFAIADDLQGSRLAYLATAPICAALALAFFPLASKRITYGIIQKTVLALSLCLAGGLLIMNNQPWRMAGMECNAIRAGLETLYATIPGDPQVMLVGLPDELDGAYVCRNALKGMMQYPQFPRTIENCLMVNRFEPILPFGFLKNSIAEHRDKIIVAVWQHDARQFKRLAIPDPLNLGKGETKTWSGSQLESITYGQGGTKFMTQPDGTIFVSNDNPGTRPSLLIKPGDVPCFDTDFIRLEVTSASSKETIKHPGTDLLVSNDLIPNSDSARRVHATLNRGNSDQNVLFALRSLPEWSLGGNTHEYKIYFPEGAQVKVKSLSLVPAKEMMPTIDFANSDYLGTKGFVHLGADKQSQSITYDATTMPGAANAEFEITRANLLFAEQNTTTPSSVVMTTLKEAGSSGEFTLKRSMFKDLGIYQGRAWALDEHGKRLGVAGDHIVISVDS